MQASSLNRPAPNPETLNMVRGPAGQQPPNAQNTQNTQGAQNAQNTQTAQNTQSAEPTDPSQAVRDPQAAQTAEQAAPQQAPVSIPTPQPAVILPPSLQNVPAMPGMEQAFPEMPSLDLGLLNMELLAPRTDGNFQAFLQKLLDTPSFPEQLNQLLQGFDPAGASGEVPQEMAELAQLLPKNGTELTALLKQQISDGSKFTGELFAVLRDAYAQAPTKSAKTEILQFLRRFNDYTSAPHIEHSMVRTLEQLVKTVPKEYGEDLRAFTQELEQRLSEGDRAGALKLMQGKLLPFLRELGDQHPDLRLPNTLISIFKPLAARYENSSEDGLLQSFRQLSEQETLKPHFGRLDPPKLLKLLQKAGEEARSAEKQQFAEQLAKTADWAMKGRGGGEPRKLFRQLLSNMLLNKSVYLPLEHAVIPMEWNGKRLVSELWVDPDAEQGKRTEDEKERLIRFLLHMDIPGLGPFDLVLSSRGEEVELQLACPSSVVSFSALIQQEMSRILESNGLKPSGIQIQKWEKPLTLPKVFPKIAKGETGVNVKI